ncbi:sensor histidine kinase [Alkaliphilus peptidifermentans]|uniref:histidine kinase n=1 Tax=Alkaliphilus peptidifermentans DSM 18978 TaxID=1120976 RepID=A0A1G5K0J1_9FIRM|nr:sensor histidine kinase [Alkaliphilus peptidifermentans]SCY93620.1 Signal transduction histidine kinase [Alkaliphilus peptidifermentans DSM 18978]
MKLTSENAYIVIFFIYGLAFFSMGLLALQQKKTKHSVLPLLNVIRYLGLFGLIHGITEWVIMLRIAQLYQEYDIYLFGLQILLNSISFVYLFIFGLALLEYDGKIKKLIKYLPIGIFIIWLIAVLISMMVGQNNYYFWFSFFSAQSRYFLGLPSTIVTALALYQNSKTLDALKLNKISLNYKFMTVLFVVYGILAGILVRKKDFFPANILNNELFIRIFGIPVELGRGITAVAITFFFIKAIDIFRWETDERITKLSQQQLVNDERRRLAREIHDGIIQNLFATGLQIENLIESESDAKKDDLKEIKTNLNSIIEQVRSFMGKMVTKKIEIEDLRQNLEVLINQFIKNSNLNIKFNYLITNVVLGHLTSEKLTNIYYIVQEALYNVVKHAEATSVSITLETNLKSVNVIIEDNGKGFDINHTRSNENTNYGLISIQERAELINGILNIKSDSKGTTIILLVPWEEGEINEN